MQIVKKVATAPEQMKITIDKNNNKIKMVLKRKRTK